MAAVVADEFREDLFHRLAIGVLQLPPLRERKGDLSLLIDLFINETNHEFNNIHQDNWIDRQLSARAKNMLIQHSWPGNIRELRNTITRLILWAQNETITIKDVTSAIFTKQPSANTNTMAQLENLTSTTSDFQLQKLLSEIAGQFIDKALTTTNGNKSKAAKLLGFNNYQTLDNWQKKQQLNGKKSLKKKRG